MPVAPAASRTSHASSAAYAVAITSSSGPRRLIVGAPAAIKGCPSHGLLLVGAATSLALASREYRLRPIPVRVHAYGRFTEPCELASVLLAASLAALSEQNAQSEAPDAAEIT